MSDPAFHRIEKRYGISNKYTKLLTALLNTTHIRHFKNDLNSFKKLHMKLLLQNN